MGSQMDYFNHSANLAAASFALTCATLPAFFRYASLRLSSAIVLDFARMALFVGQTGHRGPAVYEL